MTLCKYCSDVQADYRVHVGAVEVLSCGLHLQRAVDEVREASGAVPAIALRST